MFKRALLTIVILGMVSAPAVANMHGSLDQVTASSGLTRINPNSSGGTVGILTSGGGLYPNTAQTATYGEPIVSTKFLYPNASDVITVTFAIHWPYATPVLVSRMRHGLNWDTNEISLMGAGPAGPFVSNNIGALASASSAANQAAGASAINGIVGATPNSAGIGTQGVIGVEELVASGGSFVLNGSSVVPFARFTFHAKGPFPADNLLDIVLPEAGGTTMETHVNTNSTVNGGTSMTTSTDTHNTQGVGLIFSFFTTTQSHSAFSSFMTNVMATSGLYINFGSSSPSAGMQLQPEPASAALLGFGALAMTGGFWRRRRRQS